MLSELGGVAAFLLAAAAVCLLPGAACVLAFRPARRGLTHVDALCLSLLASIVVAQVITSVSVLAHLPLPRVSRGVLVVAACVVVFHRRGWFDFRLKDWTDRLFLGGSLALGLLVLPAEPTFLFEDQIHVSVMRRLMALVHPSLSNLYMLPGVVYTYPLPGLHGLVAAVGSLADVDPIFAYAKMRSVWTIGTLLIYYRLGATLFGGSQLYRRCSAVILLLLTLNGNLSKLPGFYAGQMTTVPHVSKEEELAN